MKTMSTGNAISIEIPQADIDAVKAALATIQTTLALTPEQRKTIPKMSDGTVPFVSKVMGYATSDPQFTPPYMDVPEMKKDFDATTALLPLLRTVDQIEDNLNDTTMLAGS
jgi:hypothetical protein